MIKLKKFNFKYDPYPYCVVENLFEDKFYRNLCKEFPNKHEMFEITAKGEDKKKFNKYTIDSENNKKFFNQFVNKNVHMKQLFKHINSDNFFNNLSVFLELNHINISLGKIQYNLISRLKNYFKKKKFSWSFEISSIPVPNGYIKPHTDGKNKILSFVIPIIDNENIFKVQNLGTRILQAKNNKYKYNFNNIVVPYSDVDIIEILPFKKNMMNLHIKTFNSLHSVGPFNKSNGEFYRRNSITCFLRKDE